MVCSVCKSVKRRQRVNTYLATFFVQKMSAFYVCCNIKVHFRIDFYKEANTMIGQSELGPYCLQYLQYGLPKNTSR